MPLSDYLEKKLLDHIYIGLTFTPPTDIYLVLYTAAPTDAGGGTEVTGGSYARQALFMNPASTTGSATNSASLMFSNMPACSIVAVATSDTPYAGGNLLHYDTLAVPYSVSAGDNLNIAIGDLTLTLD